MTYAQAYYGIGPNTCRIDVELIAYAFAYYGETDGTSGVCEVDTDVSFSMQSVTRYGQRRVETRAGRAGLIDHVATRSLQGVSVRGVRNVDSQYGKP